MRSQRIMDRINTSKAVLESQLELINKNTLVSATTGCRSGTRVPLIPPTTRRNTAIRRPCGSPT